MKRQNKKGFTIVELVIVIAVIAILAAVLIPTFTGLIKKANASADLQNVRNYNTALAIDSAEGNKHTTMYSAVQALKASGYDLAKIAAKASDNTILWDSVADCFCYVQDGEITYAPETAATKADENKPWLFWKVADEIATDEKYSVYAGNNFDETKAVTVTGIGFDAGDKNFSEVNYNGASDARNVTIRTNGDSCTLTIDAVQDDVDFYGFAKKIDVKNVKSTSLHVFGACNELALANGHVEVEDTGIVFKVSSNAGSITNNGYVAETASGITISGTQVGSSYKIGTLEQLEVFRDAVNSGNNFAGLVVELTADIKLNDGWTPIGEGARKQGPNTQKTGEWAHSGTAFAGEFDGNDYTISNLNNNGFVPTSSRLGYDDPYNMYCYGLFAMTESYTDSEGNVKGAYIHNLKLKDVNIDGSIVDNAKGDSVAALVGFSAGILKVDHVDVIGDSNIKGVDGVGSIVGRAYKQDATTGNGGSLTVTNCTSNANVSGTNEQGSKVAGIVGYVILRYEGNSSASADLAGTLTITDCTFTGIIDTSSATYSDEIALHDSTYVKLCEGCQGKSYK